MPAQIELDELNGVNVRTHGVVNLNVGVVDSPNIKVTPLVALRVGQNAFVKYNQLHVLSMGDATQIGNLRFWLAAGDLLPGEVIQTSLSSQPNVYRAVTYDVPTQATRTFGAGGNLMPGPAEPASANLGVGGLLTGHLTAPGYSDLFAWQVQLGANTPPGALRTKRFTWAWDEDIV